VIADDARNRGAERTRVGLQPGDEVLAGFERRIGLDCEADVFGIELRDRRDVREAQLAAAGDDVA